MLGLCLGECTLSVGKLIGIIIVVLVVFGGGGVAFMMSQNKSQTAQAPAQIHVGGAPAAAPPQVVQMQPQMQMGA